MYMYTNGILTRTDFHDTDSHNITNEPCAALMFYALEGEALCQISPGLHRDRVQLTSGILLGMFWRESDRVIP